MKNQMGRAMVNLKRAYEEFTEHRDFLCLSAKQKRYLKRQVRKAVRRLSKEATREEISD